VKRIWNLLLLKWHRFLERVRNEGVLFALLQYSARVGIRIVPFYYMREALPAEIPGRLTQLPEGFQFSVLRRDDILALRRLEEWKGHVIEKQVVAHLNRGDVCLGVRFHNRIVAYTWYSLIACDDELYPVIMNDNEAYLYDMYVLKEYRGRNIAPILRYLNYELLGGIGRDTLYSLTLYSNSASLRFKRKLGAQPVFLGIYIQYLKKYRVRLVLRRF